MIQMHPSTKLVAYLGSFLIGACGYISTVLIRGVIPTWPTDICIAIGSGMVATGLFHAQSPNQKQP